MGGARRPAQWAVALTDIVALAGRIGAGKSAIADMVARELSARRRSFGGVVRDRALQLGMRTDRETLQTLGDEIIAMEGWDEFCRLIVGDAAEMVVVDGVRHVGAVDGLRRLVGADRFAVIFIDAPEEVRRARVAQRDATSDSEFAAAEAHPNEREVALVQRLASVVVTNDSENVEDVGTVVDGLVGELRRLGFAAKG